MITTLIDYCPSCAWDDEKTRNDLDPDVCKTCGKGKNYEDKDEEE